MDYIKIIICIFLIIAINIIAIIIQKKIDKNHNKDNKYYNNLDIVRYICSILILILHLRPFYNYSKDIHFIFNNIITRICVPLYFIITGYFVAKKEKTNKDYIYDYIKKVIPLYLLWSAIYLPVLFETIIKYIPKMIPYIETFNLNYSLINIIVISLLPIFTIITLLYTGIYYHLWYFPALVFSLLVLKKWKTKHNVKTLLIISFILLLFGATETYWGVIPINIKQLLNYYYKLFFTTRNFLFFGLFYVVLGYCMGQRKDLYSRNSVIKLVLSVVLLFIETYALRHTKRLNSNILLACVPLVYYLFISTIYITNNSKSNFPFRSLAKYYYLLHPLIIYIELLILNNIKINPYINILGIVLITHILSIIILKYKKLRTINKI